MARRSLLFSKRRSSKATISKKRQPAEELQQPCRTKRIRKIHLPDEEEEIGDFIVVDTGTLYEPRETGQHFTSDKESNALSAPRTSASPLPGTELLEEEEKEVVIVKATSEIASPESDSAHQASQDSIVLPSASRETSDGRTSREQSLEPSTDHMPAGSRDDPIILLPLPTIDEESPSTPLEEPPLNMHISSITIPLSPASEYCSQTPQVAEDARPNPPSLNPCSRSNEPLKLDSPIRQPYGPSASETTTPSNDLHNQPSPIVLSPSRRFGDAPLGVLVTRGDQCPSKFVVSGIASNTEGSQEVSDQNYSQDRSGVTWFETVTESRADVSPEPASSESPQPIEVGSNIESGLRISTVLQDIPEPPFQELPESIGAENPASPEKCSDEPDSPMQSSTNRESTSKDVSQASKDTIQGQSSRDQERQISLPDTEELAHGGQKSKQLSLLVHDPASLRETTTFSGWNLLHSVTNKVPDDSTTKLRCSIAGESSKPESNAQPRASVSASRCSSQTLRFTSDNRVESALTTVEVQRLIKLFTNDAVVILPREQIAPAYPAGVILWQSLYHFHKWYVKEGKLDAGSETRSPPTTTMKFELLDVQWQPENVFYLPRKATAEEFRDLKQCIWDLFWELANLDGEEKTKPFRVSVTSASDMREGNKLGHLTTAYSPPPIGLSSEIRGPPSLNTTVDNMARNLEEPDPGNAHHHHRLPSVHLPTLTFDSPKVILEVEGVKTPHFMQDYLRNLGNNASNSRIPSLQPSTMRPESNGGSAVRTELLLPPPSKPERDIIAAFLPHPPTRFPSVGGPTNSFEPQINLPPLAPFGTAKNVTSDSQASACFQNSDFNKATQLPSPRPSPIMTDTSQMETLRTQPTIVENSYAANTARPMFSAQPQKDSAVPRTILPSPQNNRVPNTTKQAPNVPVVPRTTLPSPQNNRVPNTAQQAPNVPAAPMAPPPIQEKNKEIQTEAPSIVPQASRAPREKKRFRDNAMQMISGRPNIELDADETTGGRKRTYPDISGVIVDKNSEMGLVVITERGYTVSQVNTGQDVFFDQYTELSLQEGQTCVIHGSSTVLYYKQRSRSLRQKSRSPPRRPLPSQAPAPRIIRNLFAADSVVPPAQAFPTPQDTQQEGLEARHEQVTISPITAEIKLRVQKDAAGHFTGPHDFEVFQLTANLQGFFWWFTKQTGRGGNIPERLRVTLKDAMPVAKTFDLHPGRPWAAMDEYFEKMKKEIVVDCEKAKAFMPELKEFSVLVIDPEWKEGTGNDMV